MRTVPSAEMDTNDRSVPHTAVTVRLCSTISPTRLSFCAEKTCSALSTEPVTRFFESRNMQLMGSLWPLTSASGRRRGTKLPLSGRSKMITSVPDATKSRLASQHMALTSPSKPVSTHCPLIEPFCHTKISCFDVAEKMCFAVDTTVCTGEPWPARIPSIINVSLLYCR